VIDQHRSGLLVGVEYLRPVLRTGRYFVARDKDRIKELRAQIRTLATDTGLDIGEFCKVVHTTTWDIAPTAPRE